MDLASQTPIAPPAAQPGTAGSRNANTTAADAEPTVAPGARSAGKTAAKTTIAAAHAPAASHASQNGRKVRDRP